MIGESINFLKTDDIGVIIDDLTSDRRASILPLETITPWKQAPSNQALSQDIPGHDLNGSRRGRVEVDQVRPNALHLSGKVARCLGLGLIRRGDRFARLGLSLLLSSGAPLGSDFVLIVDHRLV